MFCGAVKKLAQQIKMANGSNESNFPFLNRDSVCNSSSMTTEKMPNSVSVYPVMANGLPESIVSTCVNDKAELPNITITVAHRARRQRLS